MTNSAEEIAYWYLRLNGFFLVNNFVIHRSQNMPYSADADIIAIRPPHVYEDIGGRPEDWDPAFFNQVGGVGTHLIGLVCQVKGGQMRGNPFPEPYLTYSLCRLGLAENVTVITDQFQNGLVVAEFVNGIGMPCRVARLLISRDTSAGDNPFLTISLRQTYNFLLNRINAYPEHKYRDRNFFASKTFQALIEQNELLIRNP